MKYRVMVSQDEDGVFVVEVPSLPGCISQGKTRAEALKNIQEAIEAYLESLQKHNEPVPPPIKREQRLSFGKLIHIIPACISNKSTQPNLLFL